MEINLFSKLHIKTRMLCIVLTVILLISTVMTATLAYLLNNQHRSDYLNMDARTFAVYLQKYEKNASGKLTAVPVKNAEFILFNVTRGERVQHGTSTYATDEQGRIMVQELDKGKYLFLEVGPTYAYDYDQKDSKAVNEYPFTINDETLDVVHVPVYNQRRIADLTVKKTVKNADDSALTSAQTAQDFTFTFTLTGDTQGIKENESDPDIPAEYDYIIKNAGDTQISQGKTKSGETFKLKHNETAVITGLPVGAEYSVLETPMSGYTINSKNNTGNIPRDAVTAEFTNTWGENPLSNGKLSISKKVTTYESEDTTAFSFTVTFENGGTYSYSIDGSAQQTLTSGGKISLKDKETAVFTGLPEGLGYSVVEDEADNYQQSVTKIDGSITADTKAHFVNVKTMKTNETGFLKITKHVTGSGAEKEKSFAFKVELTEDGNPHNGETFRYFIYDESDEDYIREDTAENGGKIHLKHSQYAIFPDLPAGMSYTVTEDESAGYTSGVKSESGLIVPDETSSVNFINEKNNPQKIKLTVKKVVDIENPDDTDKAFEFTVKINGTPQTFTLKNGDMKDIDLYEGDTYEVSEKDYFVEDYIKSAVSNISGTAGKNDITATITNTYIGTIYTEIKGEKTWNMNGYTGIAKPDYITVTVKNGNIVAAQKNITAADHWKWSFKLPKFESDGTTPIDYTVSEITVPGYKTEVKGHSIENKYDPVPVAVKVPVEKIVNGEPAAPEAFRFDLAAVTDNAPMPAGSANGKKTVTINGPGKADFDDIIFATPGTWVYTIKEKTGTTSGYTYDNTVYTMTVTTQFGADNLTLNKTVVFEKNTGSGNVTVNNVSSANPLVFTNAYVTSTPNETYYTPTVSKVVTGNSPVTTPENFIFTLTPNDSAFPAATQNKVEIKGEGSRSFGAIKFTQPGTYTYTIKEFAGNAKGYTYDKSVYTLTVTVVKDSNNNLSASAKYVKNGGLAAESTATFVNRHDYVPTGETVTLKGQKEWRHGNNKPENYPKSITIYVKAGNQVLIEWTVTEKEHWAWSFAVDRYDAHGNEIKYTIEEKPVSGYRTQIKGFNIINRHHTVPKEPDEPPFPPTETITIKGKKVWNHMNNPKAHWPDSVTIQLYEGNAVAATQTVTAKEDWKYAFTMPKYDTDGKEIVYRIDEVKVDGYGKYISGRDIINTFGYQDYQTPPKTGDTSNVWLWITLMIASAGLLAAMVIWGRKRPKAAVKH